MFAHVHQVSMVHAVKFVIIVYQIHGNQILKLKKKTYLYSSLVIMVVHVLLQQLVIFVNVHIHTQVPIVKQ